MSNHIQDNKTTIKKAATVQDIPLLKSDMFTTSNIVPEQHSALDIERRSSAANGRCISLQLNEQTRLGGRGVNESLMQCADESYVKLEDDVPSEHHSTTLTNEQISYLTKTTKPTLLTGGSPPLTSVKTGIDYITLLSRNMYYGTWRSWLTKWFKGVPNYMGGADFYKNRRQYPETGIQILTNNKIDRVSSKVTIPGKALTTLTFDQQAELLSDATEQGFTVARLDLYVDFIGDDVRLVESVKEWGDVSGNIRLKRRTVQEFEQDRIGGLTYYIGSRQSKRFWRCYDKGAEQGGLCHKHQRIEVELKQEYAKVASALITSKAEPPQQQEVIPSLVFVDIWANDLKWWSEFRSIKPDPLPSREKPNLHRYLTYMNKQVLPKIRMLADEFNVKPKDVFDMINRFYPDNSMSPSIKNTNLISEFHDTFIDRSQNIHQDTDVDFVGTNHNRSFWGTSESVSVMCNSKNLKHPSYPSPNRSMGTSDYFGIDNFGSLADQSEIKRTTARSHSPAPLEGVKRE